MDGWREALQEAMSPARRRLRPAGCVLPLFGTCLGHNGSMRCGRYDAMEATGLAFLFEAWHLEGEVFPPPMQMLMVEQRGEAAHVRCNSEGGQEARGPLPVPASGVWREAAR
jgi:hypothetical protein